MLSQLPKEVKHNVDDFVSGTREYWKKKYDKVIFLLKHFTYNVNLLNDVICYKKHGKYIHGEDSTYCLKCGEKRCFFFSLHSCYICYVCDNTYLISAA